MALFNETKQEINAKIVYFGPPAVGKSASIQFVHRKLKAEIRSPIKAMGGQNDRMLFFDFMPPELGEVNGFRIRFHLYTVQGEVSSPSTWKTILKGADGIVFVADASPAGRGTNGAFLQRLQEYLAAYGQEMAAIPHSVQCNKSDLPEAAAPAAVLDDLGLAGCPIFAASAVSGVGILTALSSVLKQVIGKLREAPLVTDSGRAVAAAEVPPGTETPVAESVALPETESIASPTEPSPEPVASPAEETVPAAAHEPLLELVGEPAVVDGSVQISLVVRCCDQAKHYCLSVTLNEIQAAADQC